MELHSVVLWTKTSAYNFGIRDTIQFKTLMTWALQEGRGFRENDVIILGSGTTQSNQNSAQDLRERIHHSEREKEMQNPQGLYSARVKFREGCNVPGI